MVGNLIQQNIETDQAYAAIGSLAIGILLLAVTVFVAIEIKAPLAGQSIGRLNAPPCGSF